MKKKLLALGLVAMMSVTLLAGCSKDSDADTDSPAGDIPAEDQVGTTMDLPEPSEDNLIDDMMVEEENANSPMADMMR